MTGGSRKCAPSSGADHAALTSIAEPPTARSTVQAVATDGLEEASDLQKLSVLHPTLLLLTSTLRRAGAIDQDSP